MPETRPVLHAAAVILTTATGPGLHVVLLRRPLGPDPGCWDLPGSQVEAGDTIVGATASAVFAQTGLRTALKRLVGIYEIIRPADVASAEHRVLICHLATWARGLFVPGPGTDAAVAITP